MPDRLTALLAPVARLFNVESVEAMALRLLGAALILLVGVLVSKALQSYLVRRLRGHDTGAPETLDSYRRFVRAAVLIIAILLAVHTLGLDLTHLFTAGGLLAVAAAFAMKNLSENLVAGIILRAERVIKRGDVLRLQGGDKVRVKRIGPRATIVRSKTEADLIIPNAELVQKQVSNDTHSDLLHRLEARVGVAYSSDLEQVRRVLERACTPLDWRSEGKAPQVLLAEFADSTVNYRVLVWIEDPWIAGRLLSKLNEAIWRACNDAGIVIAFPQLDVHVVSQGPAGAERWGSGWPGQGPGPKKGSGA
jgi:small-conductance mechanosensitive channel